jgi:hypothetical protein
MCARPISIRSQQTASVLSLPLLGQMSTRTGGKRKAATEPAAAAAAAAGNEAGAAPAPVPGAAEPKVKRESKRGKANTGNKKAAAADDSDHAAERRLKADSIKAQQESRRLAFDKFRTVSTARLWAWGDSYNDWPLAKKFKASRSEVIDALVIFNAEIPSSEAKLEENWRAVKQQRQKDKQPMFEDDDVQQGDDADDEQEEAPERVPVRRSDMVAAASSSSAAAAAAAASTAPTYMHRCKHCRVDQLAPDPEFNCILCGLVSSLPRNDPLNLLLLSKNDPASAAAASSSSGQSTGSTSRTKLSKRDEEYERLALEGEPFTRFEDIKSVSPEEAIKIGRDSYLATNFAAPSLWLMQLIASGKLKDVAMALPVLLSLMASEAESARSGEILKLTQGRISTSSSITTPKLESICDFFSALVSCILPALFGRQAAQADWLSLARTVLAVNCDRGWLAAKKYLSDQLHESVQNRKSFAKYDRRIMDAVERSFPLLRDVSSEAVAAAAAGISYQPQQMQQQPYQHHGAGVGTPQSHHHGQGAPRVDDRYCRDWNLRECHFTPCKRLHECMWPACTAADKRHRGATCRPDLARQLSQQQQQQHRPPGGSGPRYGKGRQ